MNEVFEVHISSLSNNIRVFLPITPYQVLDLLEQLRLQAGEISSVDIYECLEPFRFLTKILKHDCDFSELNDLAMQLAVLDIEGQVAFEKLVQMESAKHSPPYSAARLSALSRNISGRDMISDTQDTAEDTRTLLPFEKTEKSRPAGESRKPHKPAYSILMLLERRGISVQLPLPATPQTLDHVLQTVKASDWNDPFLNTECVDCAVPWLIPFLGNDSMVHVNQLAQQIQALEEKNLTKLKAILEATEERSSLAVVHTAGHLDEYLFFPQYTVPEDMARDFLTTVVDKTAMDTIIRHINLHDYAAALMEDLKCVMTEYDLISRRDGQSLKPVWQSEIQMM